MSDVVYEIVGRSQWQWKLWLGRGNIARDKFFEEGLHLACFLLLNEIGWRRWLERHIKGHTWHYHLRHWYTPESIHAIYIFTNLGLRRAKCIIRRTCLYIFLNPGTVPNQRTVHSPVNSNHINTKRLKLGIVSRHQTSTLPANSTTFTWA